MGRECAEDVMIGTDNLLGRPLSICYPFLNKTSLWIGILLFAGTWAWFVNEKLSEILRKGAFKNHEYLN
jgi:hypothetical protein